MNNIKFPWASQFIANHKSRHNGVTGNVSRTIRQDFDLRRELGRAFVWAQTKEGYDYWENIEQGR